MNKDTAGGIGLVDRERVYAPRWRRVHFPAVCPYDGSPLGALGTALIANVESSFAIAAKRTTIREGCQFVCLSSDVDEGEVKSGDPAAAPESNCGRGAGDVERA